MSLNRVVVENKSVLPVLVPSLGKRGGSSSHSSSSSSSSPSWQRITQDRNVYLPSKYPMRTHDKVIEDGEKALTTGEAVNGVTGVSPLSSSLNLVYSIPSEYMHSVVERVTRMMLNFWFDSINHGKAYYLGRKVSDINAVLIKQRPPHEV